MSFHWTLLIIRVELLDIECWGLCVLEIQAVLSGCSFAALTGTSVKEMIVVIFVFPSLCIRATSNKFVLLTRFMRSGFYVSPVYVRPREIRYAAIALEVGGLSPPPFISAYSPKLLL